MKRWIGLLTIVAGCSKAPEMPSAPPPIPVTTAEVVIRDVPLFFEEMGIVKPSRDAAVKTDVGGFIRSVHFEEGQWVQEGDLLYLIDDAPYAIQVREAEAALARDTAYLESEQKKLARYKALTQKDLISQVEWDELESSIALARAALQGDEARLASSLLNLSRCRIVAPISGRACKSALQATARILPNETLVTLLDTETLAVDFAVTEKEFARLPKANLTLEVFLPGSEERQATGEVSFVDHEIDPRTGLIAVRGKLNPERQQLLSGQAVRVHLIYGQIEAAHLVPVRSIKMGVNGPYLYTVKEDKTAEKRSVKLGPEEKGLLVVEEGLEGATKIVLEGQNRLHSGMSVEEAVR